MKYFFRSPEIYIKLKRSVQYPTVKDTPLVPIRGLWVSGIHRSIFDIDHGIQVTDIQSTQSSVNDFTSRSEEVKDEACVLSGIVSLIGPTITSKKYTTVYDSWEDDAIALSGIVSLCNSNIPVSKYETVEHNADDDGFSILGVVNLNESIIAKYFENEKYSNVADSHGVFVAGISTNRSTITDPNE